MKQTIINTTITFLSILFTLFLCITLFVQPLAAADQSLTEIEKLEPFARLFGYIRYFYAGDEAAETDWDGFAVLGVKRVRQAKNVAQLEHILRDLFRPIAPALVIHPAGMTPQLTVPASSDIPALLPAGYTTPGSGHIAAWQHQGVGFGKPGEMFRSVRVNRPLPHFFRHAYGAAANTIDAVPYRGKTVTLKAAVKVLSGRGQLWLRIDRTDNTPGFFNDMDETPIKPGEWKYYTITGPVAADAKTIAFGCILRGEGLLWVDDFQLTLKDGSAVSISNRGFENSKPGQPPQGWRADSRGYGFTVSAGKTPQGKQGLVIQSQDPPLAKPLFNSLPDFGDTRTKSLGLGISCTFPLALAVIDSHTFPAAPQRRVNGLKEAYRQILSPENKRPDNLDEGLAGVVIVWNVMRHFYPYPERVKPGWDAVLKEALASTFNDASHYDYLKTLRVMMARLNDSQAGAYMKGNTRRMYLPPIAWDWKDGQLVITQVYQPQHTRLKPGDIVADVNGLQPEDALSRKEKEISGATAGWKRFRALEELLRGKQKSLLRLKIKREGQPGIIEESLVRSLFSPNYYGHKEKHKKKSGWIGDGKYYINLDITTGKDLEHMMPELQKASEIVCDLRGSPKDNPPLICHLLTSDHVFTFMKIPQLIFPDFEAPGYRPLEWRLPALKPHLDAGVTFLSDYGVIGQGELILNAVQSLKLGHIQGRASAGSAGSTNSFYLFGRYFLTWTGVKTSLQHREPTQ